MNRALLSILLVAAFSAARGADKGGAPASKSAPPARVPTDTECGALGSPQRPLFPVGEVLEYDLDALGAEAGKLTLKVLPRQAETLPIEVTAKTHPFFAKVRRVKATAISYLHPRTLRPKRYVEDATENEVARSADVSFRPESRQVNLDYKIADRSGKKVFRYAQEALDPVSAIFLLRQLPLKDGVSLCFDSYGIRSMWRVHGTVVGKEHVSLKIGEFDAWHLQGEAVKIDQPKIRREIHLWVSADDRRLPVAAVGVMDLGAVRATLTRYARPDGAKRAAGKESLKW
jgi:Protein of unknown function (DUF3108)